MYPARRFSAVSTTILLIAILATHLSGLVCGSPAIPRPQHDVRGIEQQDATALFQRGLIPDTLAKFPPGPLSQFLRIISTLPAGAAALDSVGKILTPLQQELADAIGIQTTRSDLAQKKPCADVTVIFARGTTEPGNVGLVTGPPFFDTLVKQLGTRSLAVQGVEYPAMFAGFNLNGTEGVPSMTSFITEAFSRCANTKVVISGYSQGALVLRSTVGTLPPAVLSKISAVVTFGDPRNPAAITAAGDRALVICHALDNVCKGGFINIDHLTYAQDAGKAAQFAAQKTLVY